METPADSLESRKTAARAWFEELASRIIAAFEALETGADPALYKGEAGRFVRTPWRRALSAEGQDQGRGPGDSQDSARPAQDKEGEGVYGVGHRQPRPQRGIAGHA